MLLKLDVMVSDPKHSLLLFPPIDIFIYGLDANWFFYGIERLMTSSLLSECSLLLLSLNFLELDEL